MEIKIDEPTNEGYLSLSDPDGWWRANVKGDGCVNLTEIFNEPFSKNESNIDQMHICNLDEFIDRLNRIREQAKRHFGDNWPG